MILSNKQAKKLGINKTLDLKEIMLNAEGFYKIEKSKVGDLMTTCFYAFFWIGIVTFTYFSYNLLSNLF